MSATKMASGDECFELQKTYNNLILLLGRCSDWPKKTRSDGFLNHPTKSSPLVDVSSNPVFGRLPAGGSKPSCRSISGRRLGFEDQNLIAVSEGTQTASNQENVPICKLTHEDATQTDPNLERSPETACQRQMTKLDGSQSNTNMIACTLEMTTQTQVQVKDAIDDSTQSNLCQNDAVPKMVTAKSQTSSQNHCKPKTKHKCILKRPKIVVSGNSSKGSKEKTANLDSGKIVYERKDQHTQCYIPSKENCSLNKSPVNKCSSERLEEKIAIRECRKIDHVHEDEQSQCYIPPKENCSLNKSPISECSSERSKEKIAIRECRRMDHVQFPAEREGEQSQCYIPPKENCSLNKSPVNECSSERSKEKIAVRECRKIDHVQVPEQSQSCLKKSTACTQDPELMDKVDQLETRLRMQERSLRNLQGSVRLLKVLEKKPGESHRVMFEPQQNDCELPKKPITSNQSTQDCLRSSKDQEKIPFCMRASLQTRPETSYPSNQKSEGRPLGKSQECMRSSKDPEKKPFHPKPILQTNPSACKLPEKSKEYTCNGKTLSEEFIRIFIKPETSSSNKKNCDSNNGNNSPKPSCGQCLEDVDNFIQQFNRVFSKAQSEDSICSSSRRIPCGRKCQRFRSGGCSNKASKLSIKEEDVENLLDKFVELVSKEEARLNKAASSSCVEKCKVPRTCSSSQVVKNLQDKLVELATKSKEDCRPSCSAQSKPSSPCGSVQKRTYEPIIRQIVNLFFNSKNAEKKPAPKCGSEGYTIDRIVTDVIGLFTKPNCKTEVINDPSCSKDQKPQCKFRTTSTQSDFESTLSEIEGSTLSIRLMEPKEKPSQICTFCDDANLPVLDSMINNLIFLIGNRSFKDIVLTIIRREGNIYHVNVREMATGNVLGCLLANETAISEAIDLGLFEDIHTFCELDKHRVGDPSQCPLGASPRERGGEVQTDVIKFSTRVLSIPPGETGPFFSLTNALKLAKKSPEIYLENSELSLLRSTSKIMCFGSDTLTESLSFLSSVSKLSLTRQTESDYRALTEVSSQFLRIISGQEDEDQEDIDGEK